MVLRQLDTTSHTGAKVQLQPMAAASAAPTRAMSRMVSTVVLAAQAAPVATIVPSFTAPLPPASQLAAIRRGILLFS